MAHVDLLGSRYGPVDHLILGCRDLDEGIDYAQTLSGYRAALGGAHAGCGTRNALLRLNRHAYLEILAPDPAQKELSWHQDIASLTTPLLVGWARRADQLDRLAANYRKHGIAVIGPLPGSRTLPNGEILRWTTLSRVADRLGVLPFFIHWDANSKHPSDHAPGACLLLRLQRTGQVMETFPPKPNFLIKQHPDEPVQLRATIAGQRGEFVIESRPVPSRTWIPPEAPVR